MISHIQTSEGFFTWTLYAATKGERCLLGRCEQSRKQNLQ